MLFPSRRIAPSSVPLHASPTPAAGRARAGRERGPARGSLPVLSSASPVPAQLPPGLGGKALPSGEGARDPPMQKSRNCADLAACGCHRPCPAPRGPAGPAPPPQPHSADAPRWPRPHARALHQVMAPALRGAQGRSRIPHVLGSGVQGGRGCAMGRPLGHHGACTSSSARGSGSVSPLSWCPFALQTSARSPA